jgi:hypothetical protein
MEKDGAGYAVILYQKPIDSSNSIIASARFCASGTTGVYSTLRLDQYVNLFVFKTRLPAAAG